MSLYDELLPALPAFFAGTLIGVPTTKEFFANGATNCAIISAMVGFYGYRLNGKLDEAGGAALGALVGCAISLKFMLYVFGNSI